MKLLGLGKLHVLATGENRVLAGAAQSLRAELNAADWADAGDAAKTFPLAQGDANRFSIDLPDDHCAVLVVNYSSQIVLVEFAGPRHASTARKQLKQRKPS